MGMNGARDGNQTEVVRPETGAGGMPTEIIARSCKQEYCGVTVRHCYCLTRASDLRVSTILTSAHAQVECLTA